MLHVLQEPTVEQGRGVARTVLQGRIVQIPHRPPKIVQLALPVHLVRLHASHVRKGFTALQVRPHVFPVLQEMIAAILLTSSSVQQGHSAPVVLLRALLAFLVPTVWMVLNLVQHVLLERTAPSRMRCLITVQQDPTVMQVTVAAPTARWGTTAQLGAHP